MAKHPPAHRREVLRRLKAGEHPAQLLDEARAIADPGHAASALFTLAGDRRIPGSKAVEILDEVRGRLLEVDRPGRISEAWGDVITRLHDWRPGQCEGGKDRLVASAVQAVEAMPAGQWTQDAIDTLAPAVGAGGREHLLRRALRNRGFEVAGGKAVLRAADASERRPLRAVLEAAAPDVASALLGFLAARGDETPRDAITQAWAIEDPSARAEALRVIAWNAEDAAALDALAKSTTERDDEDAVRLLTVVAARADRLGLPDAAERFGRAQARAGALAPGHKLHRKLAEAMARAGLEAPHVTAAPQREEAPAAVPVHATSRHTLAIVDGYQGGLGAVHVRAVARAAPLCDAFGLDLALMGFPSDDVEEVVALVEAESNIGEGAGHARRLLEAGRLALVPLDKGLPEAWPGRPVATTPHPRGDALAGIEGLDGPLCLLVGLGRHGLPKRMLAAVPDHYELTGHGISLETATAMGILADRLGRVPV